MPLTPLRRRLPWIVLLGWLLYALAALLLLNWQAVVQLGLSLCRA